MDGAGKVRVGLSCLTDFQTLLDSCGTDQSTDAAEAVLIFSSEAVCSASGWQAVRGKEGKACGKEGKEWAHEISSERYGQTG